MEIVNAIVLWIHSLLSTIIIVPIERIFLYVYEIKKYFIGEVCPSSGLQSAVPVSAAFGKQKEPLGMGEA